MLYNKFNLSVARIADKSGHRPSVSGVFVTPTHTVATDTYRLLEVSVPAGEVKDFPKVLGRSAMRGIKPVIVNAKALSEVKPSVMGNIAISHRDDKRVDFITGEVVQSVPVIDDKFPDYQKIFPTGKPQAEVVVNAKYLAEVLKLIGDMDEKVVIKIYGSEKPILIEGGTSTQKARGLVMPCRW